MELRRIFLEHYRNYPTLELMLGSGLQVFAGANAQGKTNLLEAVYLLATGRSPRTSQDGELIAWDADIARVSGDFVGARRGDFTVEVALGRKVAGAGDAGRRGGGAQKRIKVNGTPRNAGDLAGLVPVVLFLADDLEIVRGEPARRRAFLDTDLAAISRTYGWAWRQYGRVIEHRNRVLKDMREGSAGMDDLAPWNQQLAEFGGRMLEVRTRFVHDLNEGAAPAYGALTASGQGMSVRYHGDWGDPASVPASREAYSAHLWEAITRMTSEEIARGVSLVGPHRDDLLILIDGKDVRLYGSQGEQRTAALALRMAEFALIQQLLDEPPLLLLDDILSELDRTRRVALLHHVAPLAQVIVTTTDADALTLPPGTRARFFHVEGGRVTADA